MNIAAKIQIRSIFTLANHSGRVSNLCGRKADKIYGVEEGHGEKNEARKEKWIKKKLKKDRGEFINVRLEILHTISKFMSVFLSVRDAVRT